MSDPFHNRSLEWELYQPLVGKTMLELGCKINAPHVYKAFFEAQGFTHISVDINGKHGSLALDLTKPLNLGTFDMVTNIGTTEHVSEMVWEGQVECWRNIVNAMHIGSVLVSNTPAKGNWGWHGCWYPLEEFYSQLAALNGLVVERLYTAGVKPREMVFARLRKVGSPPFAIPNRETVFQNRR